MARRIFHTILNPNTVWAIDAAYAAGFKSDILNFIKGNQLGLQVENEKPERILNLFTLDKRVDIAEEAGDRLESETEITTSGEAVVAVIKMVGPIIKYSEPCGQTGTEELCDVIEGCIANPQVTAIILKIDSGGGEGDAVMNINKLIKGSSKPIIAFIDSMAASAAYWIASACKEIWAGNSTDMAGSIGTYVTLADWKGYFESQGLKIEEIYASASTEKNRDFLDALAGKPEGLRKNFIDPFNETFIADVKANRNGVSNDVFTGKLFYANDAVKLGLVDGIKDFKAMIPYAIEMGKSNKKQASTNNSNKMNMETNFPNVAKVTGLKEVEATADGIHFQAEHLTALESVLTIAQKNATDLSEALTAKTTAETALATEKEARENAEKELADLKAANPGLANAGAAADDKGHEGAEGGEFTAEAENSVNATREKMGLAPIEFKN